MSKKILILNGSPKKSGNTSTLVKWFCEGAQLKNSDIEIIHTAFLKYKTSGCTSCRMCQKRAEYECVIDDEAKPILARMASVDVIVMATPLYFFGPSAQLKLVLDRMFSLYKWDNAVGTMKTPLQGKRLVLLASAFEDLGLDALEKPFALIADYTGMKFESLIVPHAGVSGDITKKLDAQKRALDLGKKTAK